MPSPVLTASLPAFNETLFSGRTRAKRHCQTSFRRYGSACLRAPTGEDYKASPSRRLRSMDEFRHRSFAQVCRAEANVSLSAGAPRHGGGYEDEGEGEDEAGLWSGEERRFKVENVHRTAGRKLKEESNASDTMLEPTILLLRAPHPQLHRTDPSDPSDSLRLSPTTLHGRGCMPRALKQVSAIIMIRSYTHDSPQLDGRRDCFRVRCETRLASPRRAVCVCVG